MTQSAGPSGGRPTTSAAPTPPAPVNARPRGPFAVGLRVVRLTDRSRYVSLAGGPPAPRVLVTYVRYPALGRASAVDVRNAPPAPAGGPFPLVAFAHGFDLEPATHTRLFRAWARAGYVVAAPLLPLTNAHAPGGPTEADLPNQPGDMRFVISRLLAASASRRGPFGGLIDPTQVAIGGHSDGGATALAVAYASHSPDRRVRAAVILSGAVLSRVGDVSFSPGSPPLLAIHGTADPINPFGATQSFFDQARPPKYLLSLLGAAHVPPFSDPGPYLQTVERVTLAFLDEYLKRDLTARRRLTRAGNVPGIATLTARPGASR